MLKEVKNKTNNVGKFCSSGIFKSFLFRNTSFFFFFPVDSSVTISLTILMLPLGQVFSQRVQAVQRLLPASSRLNTSLPRWRLATWRVVLRFSGYCSVLFGVTYSFIVTFRPVASVLMPLTIPPKYELLSFIFKQTVVGN